MKQLDLFRDTPRYYHEAVARLGRLDLDGCRSALAEHRRQFPQGPDPAPVELAAAWLAQALPGDEVTPRRYGAAALAACRALGEGRAPGVLAQPEASCRARKALARSALAQGALAGLRGAAPLGEGLPWGVFGLWAEDPAGARGALREFLERSHEDSASAWLALGDSCWALGRSDDAWAAYREGYGLDPAGATGWAPAAGKEVEDVRRLYQDDPALGGDWWAVGAALGGGFPPFPKASPGAVAQRWRQFTRLRQTPAAPPVVFFAGLALSTHGQWLATADLAAVRTTLRELHPEAWAHHREKLEESGATR